MDPPSSPPVKTLPGVGFCRAEWNAINDMKSGSVNRSVLDTTLPTGPLEHVIAYTAPSLSRTAKPTTPPSVEAGCA
jgi:hypothetical protein